MLMPQDYDTYGVHDMHDKQALFRLLQTLATSPPGAGGGGTPSLSPQTSFGAGR